MKIIVAIIVISALLTYFGPNDHRIGLPPRKKCRKCGAYQ